jgi:hypothetical protein
VYEGREVSLKGFEVIKASKKSYILWSGIIGLEAGHTQIVSIGSRRRVRTYPSHSSILYTQDPKHTGCGYQTIQAGGNGFRHLLQYAGTAYVSGQIGVVKYIWWSQARSRRLAEQIQDVGAEWSRSE